MILLLSFLVSSCACVIEYFDYKYTRTPVGNTEMQALAIPLCSGEHEWKRNFLSYGPNTRYVKLQVAHASGMLRIVYTSEILLSAYLNLMRICEGNIIYCSVLLRQMEDRK